VNEARALIEHREPLKALKILRPLAPQNRPDSIEIRFLLGLAAIGEAGRMETDEAAEA